ncbi:hypothetical protein B0O99DRAFT_509097 [Bisporella sp. PMI_857]|nr:hypothetical protein B0O99DRAFT_509097 [Bisporella sp. PMI_857]
MNDSQPPCVRCRKKGTPCTVNRSLQMLLENDVLWKQTIEQKIHNLEAAIGINGKDTPSLTASWQSRQDLEDGPSSLNEKLIEEDQQDEERSRWKIVIDLESSPGALPGHYLFSRTPPQPKGAEDIITRSIISLKNAQAYFDEYQSRLDHFLYRILGDYGTATLGRIREISPLLTTAICAVGALHLASPDFDLLYKEFVVLSAALSFSKRNAAEDVQALCIGAFWISDLSWSLVGIAVRIATDLQLQNSFSKALQGSREHYLEARLYLLVYICDHHFSVPYGRPPITRECEAVRNARKFLDCDYATEDDARLVSQVLRWSFCSNVYDAFGADINRPLSDAEVPHVRRFSIALDSLRAEWADRFTSNTHVGNYPRKGVGLQYHFAKLYLCSHALRGAGSNHANSRSPDVAGELDEIANSGMLSAVSILRAVVSDREIQSHLNGLPTNFDIMIAFAVVFLLKVSTHFSASIQLDSQEIQRLMSTLISVLKEVIATMHQHHLLVSITKGIEDLLQSCGMAPGAAATVSTLLPQQRHQILPDFDMSHGDFNLVADEVFGPYSVNEYDFLLGQDQCIP